MNAEFPGIVLVTEYYTITGANGKRMIILNTSCFERVASQQTQNICITFIQCRPNVNQPGSKNR